MMIPRTPLAPQLYGNAILLAAFLVVITFATMSCSKQAGSGSTESSQIAAPEKADSTSAGPKVQVMIISYQTQSTPNQYSTPPGMRIAATRGEEVRYLDLTNNRMRLEDYIFGNPGKKLYQTTIIDQTGSYRFEPGKKEAFFIPMTTPVPVWNFDQNVNVKWARERQLTVKPGEWMKRPCDVVSMGTGNNVWFWNEIPLKKEQKFVGSDLVVEAYRIQENTSIEASLLQVPAELKITSANGVVPPKKQ